MPVVDEKTLTLATVAAPSAPKGEIRNIRVYDPAKGAWVAPPVSIPLGGTAYGAAEGWNTSGVSQRMRMDLTVTAPDGKRASASGGEATIAPGSGATWTFQFTCPLAGTYTGTFTLHAEFA